MPPFVPYLPRLRHLYHRLECKVPVRGVCDVSRRRYVEFVIYPATVALESHLSERTASCCSLHCPDSAVLFGAVRLGGGPAGHVLWWTRRASNLGQWWGWRASRSRPGWPGQRGISTRRSPGGAGLVGKDQSDFSWDASILVRIGVSGIDSCWDGPFGFWDASPAARRGAARSG